MIYTSLKDANSEPYYNEDKDNHGKLFIEKVLDKLRYYILDFFIIG